MNACSIVANGLADAFATVNQSFGAWSAGIAPETIQAVQTALAAGCIAPAEAENYLNLHSTRSDVSSSGAHYPYTTSDGRLILPANSITPATEKQ
jgi:hypothetical protein